MPRRLLITGGFGFLGKRLYKKLIAKGVDVVGSGHEYDLSDLCQAYDLLKKYHPDIVINAAAYNGGIEFNRRYPATVFYRNTLMGLNLLEAVSMRDKQTKVVSLVASCAYPDDKEYLISDMFLNGKPNSSVACHGYAKRNLQLASQFYAQQYGIEAVCFCPTTLYGPGDTFDLERTHVAGALVKKIVDTHDQELPSLQLWGTGDPLRQFLYVDDAAEIIIDQLEAYHDPCNPLNIAPPACESEISIRELAKKISHIVGYTGTIEWDSTKPNGQMRKCLDTNGLDKDYEFTSLDEGLKKTVAYYRSTLT